MMKYRGSDDDVVGFGHFCEVRKVKEGPNDQLALPGSSDDAMDEYAAKQLAKNKQNRVKAGRFANSRCKPPGGDDDDSTNKIDDSWKKDNFKNAF